MALDWGSTAVHTSTQEETQFNYKTNLDFACKAMDFTKYQADLCCPANQNKPDNGQQHMHRVLNGTPCIKIWLVQITINYPIALIALTGTTLL